MANTTIELKKVNKADKSYDTVVVGLGMTGISCVDYLLKQGKSFAAMDSRDQPPEMNRLQQEYSDVPVYLGGFDAEILSNAKELLISPGISLEEPEIKVARDNGVRVSGDIDLFCRNAKAPIIAVTGSNGKSTVATLVSKMIEGSGFDVELGGNIGIPVLTLLSKKTPDFYVLELSSFQLERCSDLNAVAAVVLNVTSDHMDRYSSIIDYGEQKTKIYQGEGVVVINIDDQFVNSINRKGRNEIGYTLKIPKEGEFGIRNETGMHWLAHGKELLIPSSDLKIKGEHNLSNALSALSLGSAVGLPMQSMLSTLKEFKGLSHRCEWVANVNDVDWINDSKGTNVDASCAAIKGFSINNNIVLIAGGESKDADFSLMKNVVSGRVRLAILIGKDANRIASVLESGIPVYFATSLDAAIQLAAELANRGDTVLLSPACASQDMFENFEQRGEVFMKAVHKLVGVDRA